MTPRSSTSSRIFKVSRNSQPRFGKHRARGLKKTVANQESELGVPKTMSEEEHIEPPDPSAEDLANRLFAVSIAGVLSFIAVVFIFIL